MKESFHWVRSCILSSTRLFHLESCKVLIELFEKKYEARDFNEADLYADDLKNELREKETEITIDA